MIERLRSGGDALLDKTMLLSASKIGYLLREPAWNPADTWVSMRDKVCVVIGANSGLGRVVSTRLAGLGARVYLVCRNEEKGKQAQLEILNSSRNSEVFLEVTDVSRPSSADTGTRGRHPALARGKPQSDGAGKRTLLVRPATARHPPSRFRAQQ